MVHQDAASCASSAQVQTLIDFFEDIRGQCHHGLFADIRIMVSVAASAPIRWVHVRYYHGF